MNRRTLATVGAAAGAAVAATAAWWRADSAPYPYAQRKVLDLPLPFLTNRRLDALLGVRPGERVLEIGPGTGLQALHIAGVLGDEGHLDIVDIQDQMLDHVMRRAKRAGITSIAAAQADACHLPFPGATFDAAYLVTVLGEIPDPAATLRELRRVLKPTGRLVVGEFLDRHYVPIVDLLTYGNAAGFDLSGRLGPPLAYFARLRPDRCAAETLRSAADRERAAVAAAASAVSSRTVDTTSGSGGSPAAVQGGGAEPGTGGARGDAPPAQETGAGYIALPGRRAITVWFAIFTVYAGAEIFTRHADGTWGAWACGGYALATILFLVTRNWLAPLAAAIAGAFLAPLVWMILKVPDTSTAEVVVINRSADYLAKHGTPYLPARLITDWQHYNPYLPLMELFGLPREAGLPGLLGDPRVWTSLVTVAALAAAFALMVPGAGRDRRQRVAVLAAIAVSSPLVAFPLTVGVTDPPIIALTCLTLALAARRRFVRAALALAVACAMKSTAWAVVPVLAVMAWFRESHKAAVKFTGAVAGAAVLLALAAAPNALATPDAIKQNLIDYPLGTSKFKTVAASPLPGHLISQLGHAGHLTVDALLLVAVIAFAAWLLTRPPRDARDATVRLIVLYAVLFTLAPSTRYGYYAYPLALVGWLALTRPGGAKGASSRRGLRLGPLGAGSRG